MKKTLLIIVTLLGFIGQPGAQVTRISNNTNLLAGYPISATKAIFIQQNTNKLWVTDGTAANTTELAVPVTFDDAGGIILLNNKMYFTGNTAANGSELWVTDGTVDGTSLVKDINSGAASSTPKEMVLYNNAIYFYANSPTYGPELWKSDGTPGGTDIFKDINPGAAGSYSLDMEYAFFNNEVYFSAVSGNGLELWKTNGTPNGTALLLDINPGAGSSTPHFLQALNGNLFFVATDGVFGRELWKTNGTPNGTSMLKDIYPGPEGSGIFSAVELAGKLLFSAKNFTGNDELYATDGTPGGTDLLKEINTGLLGSSPDVSNGVIINNKLIFAATSVATGRELFITDGTGNGTSLFKDIVAGTAGSNPSIWLDRNVISFGYMPFDYHRTLYNGKIFIQTSAVVNMLPVSQLWITDGTPANTTLVKDFGINGLFGSYFYTQSGLYFSANDPDNGYEVFKSQGTAATTTLYADVNEGEESSYPFFQFFILNGKVFFTADDGDSGGDDRDLFVLSGNEIPLPLQLMSFSTAAISEGVNLSWATANETNSKEFEIERSINGADFYSIGTVKAKGNSNNKNTYGYLDKEAYQKNSLVLYYRLKIKDENLKYVYSPVAMIQLNKTISNSLQVSPNPARTVARLNYNSATTTPAQFRIVNMSGQVEKLINTRLLAGNNQQVVDVERLAPGIYYVEVIVKGKTLEVTRFVKN